jgi:Coenzyme PQQ synthesis protein D (PqqD)
MTKVFVANIDAVAAESFDGEMVAINIERGTYFSFAGAARPIWELLQTPKTIDELAGAFNADALKTRSDIRTSIETLLQTLVREDCVKELPDATATPHDPTKPAIATQPFVEPQVRVFKDLQDLIAIDPVHEADEFEGWPHRPPAFKLENA